MPAVLFPAWAIAVPAATALRLRKHLLALNEIFVGHTSHQSARDRIRWHEWEERPSSSGLFFSSGTGATEWARALHEQRGSGLALPSPTEPALAFFVRAARPWPTTGTSLTEGRLAAGEHLRITSPMETDAGGTRGQERSDRYQD